MTRNKETNTERIHMTRKDATS